MECTRAVSDFRHWGAVRSRGNGGGVDPAKIRVNCVVDIVGNVTASSNLYLPIYLIFLCSSLCLLSSLLYNPHPIFKPHLLYLQINISSYSYSKCLQRPPSGSSDPHQEHITSRSLPCLISLPSTPPPIIILSYSYASSKYSYSKRPTQPTTEYISNSSRASATGAGCGKPSPFSRCSYKPHLRNQPSLPPTPTPLHRQGSFRPFLLPIYISKPTYYYRYYYLGRRQPQWPQHMEPELSTAAANSAGTKRQMCKLPAN